MHIAEIEHFRGTINQQQFAEWGQLQHKTTLRAEQLTQKTSIDGLGNNLRNVARTYIYAIIAY